MKIHWAKNPLETEIELDTPQEEKLLRESIWKEELKFFVLEIRENLEEAKGADEAVKQVRKTFEDYDKISEHVDTIVPVFRQALMGRHLGDCVCLACSCQKCRAERHLGIRTIKGLNKHAADALSGAFDKFKIETDGEDDYDLKKVLDYLKNYDPETDTEVAKNLTKYEWYRKFFPDWKKSAHEAHEWLKLYQE